MSCETVTFLIYKHKNKHARRKNYFSILLTENDIIKVLLNEEASKEYSPRKHRVKVL